MKAYILLGAILAVFCSVGQAEVGQACTSQTRDRCGDDECCQIINIMVLSKKRQLFGGAGQLLNTEGTCQKYWQEGGSCAPEGVMNGYCGCSPGLTCETVYVGLGPGELGSLPHSDSRRDYMPGYRSFCTAPAA